MCSCKILADVCPVTSKVRSCGAIGSRLTTPPKYPILGLRASADAESPSTVGFGEHQVSMRESGQTLRLFRLTGPPALDYLLVAEDPRGTAPPPATRWR